MRIAQICYLAPPAVGGVEKHVLELSRALKKRGHQVEIHTSNFYDLKASPLPPITQDEIPTYRYSSKFVKKTKFFSQPIHFPGLILGLIRTNPDVIHVHSMASQHLEIGYLYARLFHKPLIVTGHYSAADLLRLSTKRKKVQKTKRLLYWEKRLKKIMSYATLIALTNSEAKSYRGLFGFQNLTVIPNGIDLNEFEASFNKDNYLLYIGRIVPEKRLEFLIKAHNKLPVKKPLLIAGYAPDKNYLKKLKELSSSGISFVAPEREKLLQLLKKAQALLLVSKNEAFGIVLLEAMASATPIIASDSGGFPEVVDDAGLLFNPDSETDLIEKICLLEDTTLAHKLQEKGLQRVQNYAWDLLAQKVEEVYLSFAGK